MISENISLLKKNQRHQLSKKRLILNKLINIESSFFDNILFSLDLFKESKIVASFLSIKSEIPTAPLNQIVEKYGKVLCLPTIPKNDSGVLVFKRYNAGSLALCSIFNLFAEASCDPRAIFPEASKCND